MTVNTKMTSIILIKVPGVSVGIILIWCIIVLVRPNSKISWLKHSPCYTLQ